MARIRERPLLALWIAIGVLIAGRLVDLQWHLGHDEFEGASEQVRAHFLVWIGVLAVLAVTALSLRYGLGFRIAFAGAVLYVPVSVWHFVEHANGADPEAAHVLLGVAMIAIVAGTFIAHLASRVASRTRAIS